MFFFSLLSFDQKKFHKVNRHDHLQNSSHAHPKWNHLLMIPIPSFRMIGTYSHTFIHVHTFALNKSQLWVRDFHLNLWHELRTAFCRVTLAINLDWRLRGGFCGWSRPFPWENKRPTGWDVSSQARLIQDLSLTPQADKTRFFNVEQQYKTFNVSQHMCLARAKWHFNCFLTPKSCSFFVASSLMDSSCRNWIIGRTSEILF